MGKLQIGAVMCSPQEEASKKFRELWGPDKAELRRFKVPAEPAVLIVNSVSLDCCNSAFGMDGIQDGSILECVVWKKPEKRTVESRKEPAVASWIKLPCVPLLFYVSKSLLKTWTPSLRLSSSAVA